MIRVAFCDDDLSVLEELSALLDRYRARCDCQIAAAVYQSPLELMADVERGVRWDILFLDVLMPGENGMDVAREVRARDEKVSIIFLTSSPEFAVQSYAVRAFFYQLKPVDEDSFFSVMDRAMAACRKSEAETLLIKCKGGIVALRPDALEYCEALNRTLILHLADGKVLESVHKLDDLEEKLFPFGCFLRVHRSYIVNMNYIDSISYRAVQMRCLAAIPVPHGKYNDLKTKYLAYAFEKDRVIL